MKTWSRNSYFELFLRFALVNHIPSPLPVLCIIFSHIHEYPLWVLSVTHIVSILPLIYPLSVHSTCPNHLNLASLTLHPKRPTYAVPLMCSFLILSILVTPKENLNSFKSATCSSASCLLVISAVSKPYNIADLTNIKYTFPFTFASAHLSQITPETFLHPLHPAYTHFSSLSHYFAVNSWPQVLKLVYNFV